MLYGCDMRNDLKKHDMSPVSMCYLDSYPPNCDPNVQCPKVLDCYMREECEIWHPYRKLCRFVVEAWLLCAPFMQQLLRPQLC